MWNVRGVGWVRTGPDGRDRIGGKQMGIGELDDCEEWRRRDEWDGRDGGSGEWREEAGRDDEQRMDSGWRELEQHCEDEHGKHRRADGDDCGARGRRREMDGIRRISGRRDRK